MLVVRLQQFCVNEEVCSRVLLKTQAERRLIRWKNMRALQGDLVSTRRTNIVSSSQEGVKTTRLSSEPQPRIFIQTGTRENLPRV